MLKLARRISSSEHFLDAVLVLLIIAASYGETIATILVVLQAAFVIEISIRVLAYYPRPRDYFRSFWNSFDLIVVAQSLLPGY